MPAPQVHNRVIYLRQLVASLKLARGIQDTLLVFSHDVWDPEINALVRWSHGFISTPNI